MDDKQWRVFSMREVWAKRKVGKRVPRRLILISAQPVESQYRAGDWYVARFTG